VERIHRPARRWSTAARWTLLAAVLAGVFGMHVLTADDGTGSHGSLPMIGPSTHDGMGESAPLPISAVPVMSPAGFGAGADMQPAVGPGSGGTDHSAMAECILFLVVGGAALALLMLRSRGSGQVAGLGQVARIGLTDLRRRGPPGDRPRLALCVIRV
jgi:hypothetical protein